VTRHHRRPIILASGSPRRRELLALTGLPFAVVTADIDETVRPDEPADAYTIRLSREKAQAVRAAVSADALIIAADTTVADGHLILGKPGDETEARAMLIRLRDRVHQVYTALTLIDGLTGRLVSELAVTDVPMRSYSDQEIDAYIASGDPFDKAGGYGIQNDHFRPVTLRSGCFSNVMGLPLCHLVRALSGFGMVLDDEIPQRCQRYHPYDCDVTDDILSGQVGKAQA
jgi:septum formation protein